MALETSTYIDGLVVTNPTGTDSRSTSDDHHRLIKAAVKRTWPNIAGEVSASHGEMNHLVGVSAGIQTQINSKLALSATSVFAQSAGYAASATNATSAVFATSATAATSAVRANSAVYANSASYALSARGATSATRATSAVRANSAVYARSANYAFSANRAQSAVDYNGSISAGQIPNASVGGQGVAELGTTAEYFAGTDLTRVMSIGSMGRPRSLGSQGYYVFPGGFTVQWGSVSVGSNTSGTDNFSKAFTTPYIAVCSFYTSGGVATNIQDPCAVRSLSTTQISVVNGDDATRTIYWIAVGYCSS